MPSSLVFAIPKATLMYNHSIDPTTITSTTRLAPKSHLIPVFAKKKKTNATSLHHTTNPPPRTPSSMLGFWWSVPFYKNCLFFCISFALQKLIRANIELRGAGDCQSPLDIAFVLFFANTGSVPKRNEYNAKYIAVLKFARAVWMYVWLTAWQTDRLTNR